MFRRSCLQQWGEQQRIRREVCALGSVGVGHEAEIALCIHYARCNLGVRCSDSLGHPTGVINFYRNITQSGL